MQKLIVISDHPTIAAQKISEAGIECESIHFPKFDILDRNLPLHIHSNWLVHQAVKNYLHNVSISHANTKLTDKDICVLAFKRLVERNGDAILNCPSDSEGASAMLSSYSDKVVEVSTAVLACNKLNTNEQVLCKEDLNVCGMSITFGMLEPEFIAKVAESQQTMECTGALLFNQEYIEEFDRRIVDRNNLVHKGERSRQNLPSLSDIDEIPVSTIFQSLLKVGFISELPAPMR